MESELLLLLLLLLLLQLTRSVTAMMPKLVLVQTAGVVVLFAEQLDDDFTWCSSRGGPRFAVTTVSVGELET